MPGAFGRQKTPTRPLYAARLPPIQHPLGAPNTSRPEDAPDESSQPEAVITTTSTGQIPRIRPTTARPVGTQLSAKTNMTGANAGLKPLPAIGEPYKSKDFRESKTEYRELHKKQDSRYSDQK
jgi:hypothetical protein